MAPNASDAPQDKKKPRQAQGLTGFSVRRDGDSNSRYLSVHTISSRAPSANSVISPVFFRRRAWASLQNRANVKEPVRRMATHKSGEQGIRTLGGFTLTRFRIVRLRPTRPTLRGGEYVCALVASSWICAIVGTTPLPGATRPEHSLCHAKTNGVQRWNEKAGLLKRVLI